MVFIYKISSSWHWISSHSILFYYQLPPYSANLVQVAAQSPEATATEPLTTISADTLGCRSSGTFNSWETNVALIPRKVPLIWVFWKQLSPSLKANLLREPLWLHPSHSVRSHGKFPFLLFLNIQNKSSIDFFEQQEASLPPTTSNSIHYV